jgi:6-phosphogluconolactonase/glucosamine-6-phosphate isomerase/deaminase
MPSQIICYHLVTTPDQTAELIGQKLLKLGAAHGKIRFLAPGGSAAPVAIKALAIARPIWPRLCLSLTDERYGQPGHSGSNWQLLVDQGLAVADLNHYEVLQGKSIEDTTDDFGRFLAEPGFDYSLGLFGIGADGHTAGILPGSPAVVSPAPACHFRGPDYARITTTARYLSTLDEALVYAIGANKHSQLTRLKANIEVSEQPAQALKRAGSLSVINDFMEGDYENRL